MIGNDYRSDHQGSVADRINVRPISRAKAITISALSNLISIRGHLNTGVNSIARINDSVPSIYLSARSDYCLIMSTGSSEPARKVTVWGVRVLSVSDGGFE